MVGEPRTARRRRSPWWLLVPIVCVALVGCGGGDDDDGGDQAQPTRPSLGSAANRRAAELFTARCGGCHTLSAAGTRGSSPGGARGTADGPNLDYRKVSAKDALFAIRNGGFSGGVMPANIVVGKEAEAVADFVARSSGTKASGDLDSADVRRLKATPAGAAAATVTAPPSAGIDTAFLRAVFDSAQTLWKRKFAAAGVRYEPAHLIFFHDVVHTPCGTQTARTGPFYCPAGHGVYLNTDFFDALGRTFGLSSPFAPGYVTAHEVAHHVQQLLGLHRHVALANHQDPAGANNRSVRVELQADCYAGVWLHSVARAGQLSEADVADILRAAAVVGDDFQRNKAGVELAPETWTHGSSRQRVQWVSIGKDTGAPARCDTFAAG